MYHRVPISRSGAHTNILYNYLENRIMDLVQNTLVNVYVDLVVFTRFAGTS